MKEHLCRFRVAYVVLLISLVPTLFVFFKVRANLDARDHARFERLVSRVHASIDRRIVRCVDQMYNLRALFAASQSVEWDEWRQYIASMEIRHSELGIRTLGFIERVTPENKQRFLKQCRIDIDPNFSIVPDGERPLYYPAAFISHFDPSAQLVHGLDHGFRPERLLVIEQAIETNRPCATELAKFMAKDGIHTNAGIFVYLPVFKSGAPVDTAEQRRTNSLGVIFMCFLPKRALADLLGAQSAHMDIEIYDGPSPAAGRMLYDQDSSVAATEARSDLSRQFTVSVLNREWTIAMTTLPSFELNSRRHLQWFALAGGLVVSALLFGITLVQINARNQAEESAAKLHRSETALAAEKERLGITLQCIADGVVTTDMDERVLSVNKAAERMLGRTAVEMHGKTIGEVFTAFRENPREPYPNLVGRAIHSREVVDPQDLAILVSANNEERVIAGSAAPLRNVQGEVLGAVLVFRDLTARRKSEEEMLKESKLESVGLLAGGIAHDFNNILTGIIGNISLARMSAHSTERMLDRLGGVERSALRARDLTHQLLTFARGGAPIRKPMQLGGLVKDACQFALIGSSVQCEYSLPSEVWPVEIDEGQFRQILNHLVLNAMQAMPSGGQMEVRLKNVELTDGFLPPLPAGNYVKLSIKDYGMGIKPEDLSRIFEPYFTTKKGNNGLGLATAYSVVRKHEGQIRVESSVGLGTVFHIYLPASVNTPTFQQESGQTEFLGQGRLLIMDDEREVLEVAGEILKAFGYEVETARDGAEAIEKYVAAKNRGERFSAVIMDLTVPNGMGGREAVRSLKEIDPEVKAIVSSGYSLDPVMANYRDYGFCGIIPKPYQADELGRALDEVLGRSGQAPRAADALRSFPE